MNSLIFVTSLLLTISGSLALFDPYQPGPYAETIDFEWSFQETGLWKNVAVYGPKNATGSFPVVYYSQSFAGSIDVKSVKSFLQRLATYGYTIVAPWRQMPANYTVQWIDPVIDYAQENAKMYLDASGGNPDYFPDFSRMIGIGHSAGNHILVNYLKRIGCRSFLGAIHMSPVDGTDPFGIIQDEFCITPGELLNYDVPTLVLMAGLDPIPAAPLQPACAPKNLSNTRFYDAMPGNRWFVNASDYGHVDFFEPEFLDLVEFLNFCETDETTDKVTYTDFVAGTCVAFMEGLLKGDEECEMLRYVEDPALMPVKVLVESDVDPATRCNAQCQWTPPPTDTPFFPIY